MGVLVILEMDGPTDALLAAAGDLEARRPTPAILARMVAGTESGVVVVTFWERRKMPDAAALSKEALQESENISRALAVIDLQSPSIATLAQDRLGKICASCHVAHRERLADGTYRIKQ